MPKRRAMPSADAVGQRFPRRTPAHLRFYRAAWIQPLHARERQPKKDSLEHADANGLSVPRLEEHAHSVCIL